MHSAKLIETAQDEDRDPGEVVVFLLWHLGDVLNATALLPDLEARHGRKLSFATIPPCVPIVERHPSVDRVRVVDLEIPEVMTVPMWVDLRATPARLYPWAATVYNLHVIVQLHHMPHHIVELWAREAGLDRRWTDLRPQYHPQACGLQPAFGRDYLVLGNGGSAAAKRWPDERWRFVIDALRERHPALRLVQVGTKGDPPLAGVEDLRGTRIDESHELLRGARGCVTNDSFLAHLSGVAGCPTIVLFGPTCPDQFRPLAGSHVLPLGGHGYRTPCTRNWCRLAPRSPCRAFPRETRVLEAIERILARRS